MMNAVLPQTLMHAQADACVATLTQALQSCEPGSVLEVDAGGLQRFDSSALSVILELRRRAQASGCAVRVLQAPDRLQVLSRLYGVEALVLG